MNNEWEFDGKNVTTNKRIGQHEYDVFIRALFR